MGKKKKLIPLGQVLEICNVMIEWTESHGATKLYPRAVLDYLNQNPDAWDSEDWPGVGDGYKGKPSEGEGSRLEDTPYNERPGKKHFYTGIDSSCARKFRKTLRNTLSKLRTEMKKHALPQRRRRKYGKVTTRNVRKVNRRREIKEANARIKEIQNRRPEGYDYSGFD